MKALLKLNMKETNLTENTFEEFEKTKKRRRKLLPWWIKVFCWIFMLFGVLSFVCLILGFTNIKPGLAFYGFETNEPFSLYGLIVISIGLLKGFTAFSLWFEKDFAIKIGKIDAIIGIVLCGISMLVLPFFQEKSNVTIRLELALLIPYLIKLNKIQKEWEGIN
jgi:hypothetical protein